MRLLLIILGLLALAGTVVWLLRRPSHDRVWSTDQAVLPVAEFGGDSVLIRGVRNFRWTSATTNAPAWEDRSYRLDQVAAAWYVLVPFSDQFRGPAHGFVTFGFDDGRHLAISVEARREQGETYGAIAGIFRTFELIYVIGDERDLVGRRAVYDDDSVYLYPVRAARADVRAMLTGMLQRANGLRARPEFYNTLTNSCALNLIRHVNQIAPGRIPASWRIVLPGYSDKVVHALGLIDSSMSLEQARARYRINDRAAAALDSADFSALIRRE